MSEKGGGEKKERKSVQINRQPFRRENLLQSANGTIKILFILKIRIKEKEKMIPELFEM